MKVTRFSCIHLFGDVYRITFMQQFQIDDFIQIRAILGRMNVSMIETSLRPPKCNMYIQKQRKSLMTLVLQL